MPANWRWNWFIHLLYRLGRISNRLRFDTFLLSYFLLKMVLVMNKLHCRKKIVTYLIKILKQLCYDIITKSTIFKQHFTRAHVCKCSTELLVFWKGFFKNWQISLENTCVRLNVTVWFYQYNLHPHYRRDSCTQLFFSEFCRIFENTFLLEHSWASDLTYLKQTNTWKWVFYQPFFTEKVKQSKKSEVAVKLGNLRFALQWKNSFVELLLSSC